MCCVIVERLAGVVPGAKHGGMAAFVIQPLECSIAILLLVASCVDRSLPIAIQYATTTLTILTAKSFRLDFLLTIEACHFLSDRSMARIDIRSRRHPGTIGSHAGIGIHPHIYNSDNPR